VTPPNDAPNAWAQRLLKAEAENRCGDVACQTRRTSAAVRVLTGWKEHQDYAWAVEAFEVEIGVRDPATVGSEPDNIPSRATIEALGHTWAGHIDCDPADCTVARWARATPEAQP
jgi:hypothetical protein